MPTFPAVSAGMLAIEDCTANSLDGDETVNIKGEADFCQKKKKTRLRVMFEMLRLSKCGALARCGGVFAFCR